MGSAQALWSLAQGEALRMNIGPGARELAVTEGRVWLTSTGSLEQPAEDRWIEAGQSVALAAGTDVVLEAWPQAHFELLVPPSACKVRTASVKRSWAKPSSWTLAAA